MNQILSGLRVVDAATYIAAPSAAAMLADFGADVVKVERPPLGDPFRQLYMVPGMPASDHNYPFLVDNRSKRGVAIDLSIPAGRAVFLRLATWADILVTNYQPQMLRRFRIAYDDLEPLNPRLIHASITGYGELGPEADKPGYDMTGYFARSGLMSYIHNADSEPAVSPCGFGDHPSAVSLFAGIVLALYRREQTGRGSKVTTTLMGNGAWSNASLVQAALCGAVFPPKWTRAASPNPLVNHYRASDGSRFLFCLLDPERDWARLCAAMERPDLVDDARFASVEARRDNHRECVAVLDDEFARRPMQEWARRFDANDVLFGPVPATADVAADNQIRINGGFTPMADAPFETVTSPVRVEGLDKRRPTMPPRVGQHTRGVLGELGYSEGEIVELESSKAVLHAD